MVKSNLGEAGSDFLPHDRTFSADLHKPGRGCVDQRRFIRWSEVDSFSLAIVMMIEAARKRTTMTHDQHDGRGVGRSAREVERTHDTACL